MNKLLRLSLLRQSLGVTSIFGVQRTSLEIPISVDISNRKLWTTSLCGSNSKKIKKEKENKLIKEKIESFQEEENEEEEVDDGLPKDYKEKSYHIGSRRVDSLLHRTIGKSSTEVEKLILTGKVRINDQRISKKAHYIEKGDQIDIFLEVYPDNDKLAHISRIYVKNYLIKENGYHINVKFWKKMLVERWKK